MSESDETASRIKEAADTKATPGEIGDFLNQAADWRVEHGEDSDMLCKKYLFDDFASALGFTNTVGEFADDVGHHPEIVLSWGRAEVRWWTHSSGGISYKDIECAKICDTLSA